MRQSRYSITGAQKNILAFHGLYLNTNIKVNKSDATLDANEILPAGTIVDKAGKTAADATAFGVVYEDVDFKDSQGTEIVPVTIFGFVNVHELPVQPSAAVITALKMIQFIDDGLVTTTTTAPATTTTTTV